MDFIVIFIAAGLFALLGGAVKLTAFCLDSGGGHGQ